MKILLTNDDGLFSNGLMHLEQALSKHEDYDVWCVAPDRQRSATSQAITLRESLLVKKIKDQHFTVNGFPADCVNVALYSELFPKFDLVLSGINHGFNLGDDVHYSGTVGAARHAAVHAIKALSLSAPITDIHGDFKEHAKFLVDFIHTHHWNFKPRIVYNLNFPEGFANPPKLIAAQQGVRRYHDSYDTLEEREGEYLLRLRETLMGNEETEGSDFWAVKRGFVSVTPLSLDTTHHEAIDWIL